MPGCGGQALPDPIGLDSGSTGGCKVDWANASLAPQIGHVAGNTYWTQDGEWSFGCGNATSGDHRKAPMEKLLKPGQCVMMRALCYSDCGILSRGMNQTGVTRQRSHCPLQYLSCVELTAGWPTRVAARGFRRVSGARPPAGVVDPGIREYNIYALRKYGYYTY